jgi:hypothetical protein
MAPAGKDKLVRWGMRLVQEFRKRWRIETGFRDHELFTPTSHARDNATKSFLHVLDLVHYNLWNIQGALQKKAGREGKSKRRALTLHRYSRETAKAHVRGKNSASPIVDAAISSAIALIR